MSVHCLLCGHQDNWIPDIDNEKDKVSECRPDDKTWVIMKIHNDPDTKLTQKSIEEWWVHRLCMKNFVERHSQVNSRLKDEVKWI